MPTNNIGRRIGDTLDNIPFSAYHLTIIIILALVGYLEAYATALTGSLVVLAKSPLKLTEGDITWLVVGPTVTLCMVMFLSSFVSDSISRKNMLLYGVFISTFFTFVLIFVTSPAELIVIRLLSGIGFGMALPAAYPLGSEIMPPRHRRTFGTIYELLLAFGFVSVAIFGYLGAHSSFGWRLSALPGALLLFILPPLIYFFVPESPRWLVSRGRPDAGIAQVNKIIRWSGKRIELLSYDTPYADAANNIIKPKYVDLFLGRQMQKTLVSIGTWVCALVAFYLFSTMLPKALIEQGDTMKVSFGITGLLFIASMPGKLVDGFLMEKIGRRLTILITFSVACAGLILMSTAHSTGEAFGKIVFIIGTFIVGFSVISSFPVVRIYMTEQFPTELRGRGYFLSEAIGRGIAGIAIPYFIIGHLASPIIFFGTVIVFTMTGAVVPILFGNETVGQLEVVTQNMV
jgi:putative MFS transporter